MNFVAEIKSRFQEVNINQTNTESVSFEILFPKSVDSVFVTLEENERFAVSYPAVKQDHRGKLTLYQAHSSNILLAGILWILEQIEKNGKVMPEFM
ncbi:hypothetical protein [Bernardetia sp.]|uniref:hypothetical protein n=1 Tax=Bernardetia sp. TaxID=1937974 RepID=UPI0025B85485|nr:hypothetical protein [Bernardetia sp.]